jgi:SAM-dependent methyltransferase
MKSEALSNNQRTLNSYEGYARQYAGAVASDPSDETKEGILRMKTAIGESTTILEIGSGPGWDADFIESLGLNIKRTDATLSFRQFQEERGKQVDPLNILTDRIDGRYDGVMAMCVLLNIDRGSTSSVLTAIARSLRTNGAFLVSIREGKGELWERSDTSGDYHVVLWEDQEFRKMLINAGLNVNWHARSFDEDGTWLTYLAIKLPKAG